MKITKIAQTEFNGKGTILDGNGLIICEANYLFEVEKTERKNVGFQLSQQETHNQDKVYGRLLTQTKLADTPGDWLLQFEDNQKLRFEEIVDLSEDEEFGVYTFEGVILQKE